MMEDIGEALLIGAVLFFFCGNIKYWPYCLGAALIGVLLIVADRLTRPSRG